MYQAERIATIHFGNCSARNTTFGVGCDCGAITAAVATEANQQQRRCIECRRPIVDRDCKVCAETQDLVNAVASIEQRIDLIVDDDVAVGVKKMRAIIARRIAGPVGWPKSFP